MPLTTGSEILEQIGQTPLVRLNHLAGPQEAAVWGKLESTNPGGSVKDRIALAMITAAEDDRFLGDATGGAGFSSDSQSFDPTVATTGPAWKWGR